MKTLLMALAAMVLMAVGHPANAQRLPGSNSELGCNELNERDGKGRGFLRLQQAGRQELRPPEEPGLDVPIRHQWRVSIFVQDESCAVFPNQDATGWCTA